MKTINLRKLYFSQYHEDREIADEENVSMTSITTTVRDAVLKLRDYFIKHGWLEFPKEATVCTRVATRKRIRKKTRRNRS